MAQHGHDDDQKHATMTAPLAGVAVLVSRGMGMGAQQHLVASGIQPILTDLHTIDEAVEHYVAGTLVDNPRGSTPMDLSIIEGCSVGLAAESRTFRPHREPTPMQRAWGPTKAQQGYCSSRSSA